MKNCTALQYVALLSIAIVLLFEASASATTVGPPTPSYTVSLDPVRPTTLRTRIDLGSDSDADTIRRPALPFKGQSEVVRANASATAEYDLSSAGLFISAKNSLPNTVAGFGLDSRVLAQIVFTSDHDLLYDATGHYSAIDSDGHNVVLSVRLQEDNLEGRLLFASFSQSISTPDEHLTLGVPGGDASNRIEGSLTGSLRAHQRYKLSYNMSLGTCCNRTTDFAKARASGRLKIHFSPVPEPTSATLIGLGLVCLCARTRRGKTAQ